MNLRQAVHEFISALELTQNERDEASRQHIYLREKLQQKLTLDPNHQTFLTGSYKRSTAIRPLKDIDLFCVLKRSDALNPEVKQPRDILRLVQGALTTTYPDKISKLQNRSVNIEFTGTGIGYDVVPAFIDPLNSDIYFIPDLKAACWIQSNPKIHEERSITANAATNSELKPLTKAIKHWNRGLPDGERLRSFHLEVMAWDVLQVPPVNRLEGLIALFEGLSTRVFHRTPEPAGLGPDLDEDVTDAHKRAASDRLKCAAVTVRDTRTRAEDGRTEAAHHLLYGLFGDPYPEQGKAEPTSTASGGAATQSGPDGHHSRFG